MAMDAAATSVVVRNGFEFHASMTSPTVTIVLVADNITFTLDTCPFPASPAFPATILDRNVRVMSLSPAAAAEAAAAGMPLEPGAAALVASAGQQGPFWINCNFLNGRFQLAAGRTLEFNSVVLTNCRTLSTAGFVSKAAGSTLVLNNTVDVQGSVCLPLPAAQGVANSLPRQPGNPVPHFAAAGDAQQQQQLTALAPPGSSWCSAPTSGLGGAGSSSTVPQQLLPTLLVQDTGLSICGQPALLLGSTAWLETPTPINGSGSGATASPQQPTQPADKFTMLAVRSALLCPDPIPMDCVRANGTDTCLAAAFAKVDPDVHPPCPARDGFALHNCLVNQAVTTIMLLSTATMNLTTCPSWLSEDPFVLNRSITLMSDPRGPRMVFDCSGMTDRVQLPPGRRITLQHIILANCSIGAEKPLAIIRLDQGAQLDLVDTILLQPRGLCLPLQQQAAKVLHAQRPASVPAGTQSVELGQPGQWCARAPGGSNGSVRNADGDSASTRTPSVDPASGAADNNSYSTSALPPLPQVYGSTTGFGPAYAATLDQPAAAPYFMHPTWPGTVLCSQQVLLLKDWAYNDPYGWSLPPNLSRPVLLAALRNASSSSSSDQQPQGQLTVLAEQLGPGYNGTVPVHYIDSAWLCADPSTACASQLNDSAQRACLQATYARTNPDVVGAAGAAGAGNGGNYGVQVVLPAVLGSVGGALLLAGLAWALLAARHRRQLAAARASLRQAKGQGGYSHDGPAGHLDGRGHEGGGGRGFDVMGWLTGTNSSAASSANPTKRLLGAGDFTPAGTSPDGTTPASSQPRTGGLTDGTSSGSRALSHMPSPDGIALSMLLGHGSFGRVYSGVWNGARVAVKIINHSAEDDTRISSELSLSLSFDHPNLVRALHYARIRINPNSPESSLGTPSNAGTGSLFLPEGAVGVFELPSTWAVIQRQGLTGPAPMIDTETWIVMDLMDRGNLAAAIRQGAFLDPATGQLRAAALLRRCADIAAGMSYLHQRNVCHGDLKCENVLLRTEPQDPDGLMAAVADFGLSRALAFGQSHLSTRRYGTVTHQPPELLVAGKLTPAADVYSYGIMLWELVSRSPPFAGLHHGEVIHKVVTQDLRPGPWPAEASTSLPPDYIALAEACWARQAATRPSADQVLQRLVDMLHRVEAAAGLA